MAYIRKNSKTYNHTKGGIGEDIGCKFLGNKGYLVINRNYRKAWGELDIIATKDNELHFFEVKSMFRADYSQKNGSMNSDKNSDIHNPEDNVHGLKMRHIRRMIETYLFENNIGLEKRFHFHVLCVYIDTVRRKAKVKMIENIIL